MFANLTIHVNQHCRALEISNLEENIDLSRIDLAVPELKIQQTHLTPMYRNAPLEKM